MPFPLLAVLGAGAAVTGIIALVMKGGTKSPADASGSTVPGLPKELKDKVNAALAVGDPIAMNALADELEKAGFKPQAESLRAAAKEVAAESKKAAEKVPLPTPAAIVRTPAQQPKSGAQVFKGGEAGTVTATPEKLTYVVKDGDTQSKIAKKLTGNERRWPELNPVNKHLKFSKEKYGTIINPLYAGMVLNLPESWRAGLQSPKVEGDQSASARRSLAGRVALEVEIRNKGSEDRALIARFQQAEGLKATGLFDSATAGTLAVKHGIVPLLKFADGKAIYWRTNPAPEKKVLRKLFSTLAAKDPSRVEEWKQAAHSV